MDRGLSPGGGAPCTAPPMRHADSAEPYCASSPSRARSPVSPCRVDAKPGSPMPPPLQPSGPLRSREDQPSGRVRFQSATWVRITAAATSWSPKKSVLHQTISAIRRETWEAVNRAVLASAKQDRLESGATVRIDSTVTAALMHEPSDSALLWDAVRIMTRLLRQAAALPGAPALQWRDRRRLAKKRARAIEYSRGKDNRRRLYGELIAATRATQAALHEAGERLADLAGIAAERWRAQLGHYLPLIERILAQSQRRVLDGQAVPAGEKLVSLFEPHADIILKRCYGASGEDKASSSLETTDGVPHAAAE